MQQMRTGIWDADGLERSRTSAVIGTTLSAKEIVMPKIIITHSVVDVDSWLTFKSERAEAIGGMGGANVVDHVAQDGSNAVAITADMEDVEAAMTATTSPPAELRAAMERHGVVPPLTVYVEK